MANPTNVADFLGELNGGVLIEKLAVALSEAAMATCLHGGSNIKGKVSLELSMSKMGDHDQLIISHKIGTDIPSKRGRKAEYDTTETAMFVGPGGVLSINQPREELSGQFGLESVKDGK